jgi:hypothetical protein
MAPWIGSNLCATKWWHALVTSRLYEKSAPMGGVRRFMGDRSRKWRPIFGLWYLGAETAPFGFAMFVVTQKPLECMRPPIENNSSPGQAVYQPLSGSGTTIIAAGDDRPRGPRGRDHA